MAAVEETLVEQKHEKVTMEKEEMEVDKEEVVMRGEEDGGVGKEEEAKSDDAISPKTPGSRPTRERKTVERYFESLVARGSATKPLSIEKGQGTQLKDIPNVAYMLSKRKPDDNLQTLHSILFGKKTKAHSLKKNIGQFSGYVWIENEEKQRAKIKEKLDKCVKEKLLVFCDILNIPVSRSASKKDELSVKLLDFLESPHSTTESLLAEKEQKSKKRKLKGKTSKRKGSADKASGKSAKHKKSEGEKRNQSPEIEEDKTDDEPSSTRDESADDNDDEEANEVGSDREESGSENEEEEEKPKKKKSNGNVSSKEDSESGSEEEEEKPKKKRSNGNVSSKKDSGNKVTEKPKAVKKVNPKISSSTASKRGASDADSLVTPKKQKAEKKSQKENEAVQENGSNKKNSTKSVAKVSEKGGKEKSGKKAKVEPSNEEIHAAAENILKEVDFNSATLSDIIRTLGNHFGVDLMHRKAELKAIITDVINNMSDEEDGDDSEAEKDENNEGGDPEAENDEKNEGDDPETENDEEKIEGDDPEAECDEDKNEVDDSDA
ncbi:DEK domain-containing chromatin-associated protein 1 isoform X3 [Capsicum annuum]|uniref:DEK domain-containing chromatin-associated protein 1 isoform X3 n=1 Tax=Capsicum annuum TaxID=4072 RepID=UPI001FB087FA|nr:DEK domain-containing chromatin-associated protein 1 isoform X3 [Capsicum annuum]